MINCQCLNTLNSCDIAALPFLTLTGILRWSWRVKLLNLTGTVWPWQIYYCKNWSMWNLPINSYQIPITPTVSPFVTFFALKCGILLPYMLIFHFYCIMPTYGYRDNVWYASVVVYQFLKYEYYDVNHFFIWNFILHVFGAESYSFYDEYQLYRNSILHTNIVKCGSYLYYLIHVCGKLWYSIHCNNSYRYVSIHPVLASILDNYVYNIQRVFWSSKVALRIRSNDILKCMSTLPILLPWQQSIWHLAKPMIWLN